MFLFVAHKVLMLKKITIILQFQLFIVILQSVSRALAKGCYLLVEETEAENIPIEPVQVMLS